MKKLKFTQAFTGVEVLLVMTLLMMIAGLIIVSSRGVRENAKKRKAEAMIAALEVAISMYQADVGAYPLDTDVAVVPNISIAVLHDRLTNIQHRAAGSSPISGWCGPYIKFKREDYQNNNPTTNTIVDSWKRAYTYDSSSPVVHNTNSFDLWSDGPKTSTPSDDITNW